MECVKFILMKCTNYFVKKRNNFFVVRNQSCTFSSEWANDDATEFAGGYIYI